MLVKYSCSHACHWHSDHRNRSVIAQLLMQSVKQAAIQSGDLSFYITLNKIKDNKSQAGSTLVVRKLTTALRRRPAETLHLVHVSGNSKHGFHSPT